MILLCIWACLTCVLHRPDVFLISILNSCCMYIVVFFDRKIWFFEFYEGVVLYSHCIQTCPKGDFFTKKKKYFWYENRKSLSKRKGIYAFNLSTKIFIHIARIKQWQVEPFTRPKQIFFLSFQQMSPFFQQDGSMTLPPAY